MVLRILGTYKTIPANGSDTLYLEPDRDGEVISVFINATGRARITRWENFGVEEFVDGSIELDALKTNGNAWILPEPVRITKGKTISISVEDLSGASNLVSIALLIRHE